MEMLLMMMMMLIKGGLSSDQYLLSNLSDVALRMLPVESNIAVHGNDGLTHSSVIVSSPVVKSNDAVLANDAVIAHEDSLPPPPVASSQVIHSDVAAPALPVVPAEIDGVYSRDTYDVLSDHDIDDDLHAIPFDDDGGSTSEMLLDCDRYWGDDQPSVNAATVAADDFTLSNALASAAAHPDAVPLSSGTDPPSNYNSFCHMVTKLLTLDVVGKNHDTNGIDGVGNLLLDTGADVSLCFQNFYHRLSSYDWIKVQQVHTLQKPVSVTSAFGHAVPTSKFVHLRINPFSGKDIADTESWIDAYALLLPIPSKDNVGLVLGKDLFDFYGYSFKQDQHFIGDKLIDSKLLVNNNVLRFKYHYLDVGIDGPYSVDGSLTVAGPSPVPVPSSHILAADHSLPVAVCSSHISDGSSMNGACSSQPTVASSSPTTKSNGNISQLLLEELKDTYPDVFSEKLANKPDHSYKISLVNFDYNKRVPFYPIKEGDEYDFMKKYVQESLDANLIEVVEDHEALAIAPIFLVTDKYNGFRPVNDYRLVNPGIPLLQLPSKSVHEVLSCAAGFKYFSKLDIRKAFWNILLTGSKVGFVFNNTRFSFRRLPFGLNNSPRVWSRYLAKVLEDINVPGTRLESYVDDIVLMANSVTSMKLLLHEVFKALQNHNLRVKESKVQLLTNGTEVLGHYVNGKEYKPILNYSEQTLASWEPPKNRKSLQKLLGLFNYLKNHIVGYFQLLQPLKPLLRKDAVWNQELVNTHFGTLMRELGGLISLAYYNPNHPTSIFVDASKFGVGGLILQGQHIIGCIGFSFTSAQSNYATIERELYAILGIFSSYPFLRTSNQVITVYSDHQPLNQLNNMNKCINNLRVKKALDALTGYGAEIRIRYVNGENNVADILSRYNIRNQKSIGDVIEALLRLNWVDFNLKDLEIRVTADEQEINQEQDPSIDGVDHGSVGFQDYSASSIQLLPGQKGFPKYQLDNLTPSDIEKISQYFTKSVGKEALGSTLVDVLPYFLHLDGQLKVVFDKTLVNTVVDMKSFVEIATKQHQLFHGNVQALAYIMFYVKKLWTPGGIVLLQVVVKNCQTCDIYMSFKTIPSSLGSFHFYSPFTTFSIDYIELPPSRMAYVQPITPSKPYKYVLQAVEMSTGLLFGVPAMSADSLTVFTLLYILKMIFPTAKVITSDNGSHFRNGYVTEIAQKFGLQWTFGATYTPQNQGRIERCNQSLKRVLKTLVSDKEGFSDWINHYFHAVSIYNSTPNLCGYSPFYLSYGVHPSPGTEDKNPELQSIPRLIPQDRPHDNVLLFKLDSGLVLDAQSVLDHEMFYTAIRLAAINSDIQPSREKNFDSKYQARQMRRILAEPLGKKFTYSVGQWVYLRRFKPNHKLQPGYVGPFIVNKILGPTRYQLRYPDLASETYIPPNTIDGKVPVAPTSQISGSKVKLLPGVNDYNAKDLRPYYMAYGSPLLSVADLSQRFGAQERSTFKRLLDGYEHEVSVSANRLSATASLAFLEHVLDVYIESPPDF